MHGNKDSDHLTTAQERARVSPVRARMLDLYEDDHSRSMTPQDLVNELTREGWEVSLSQVNYHLRRLQDAKLVPAPCFGG
jgi:Fe2+ or Zn2+ uptake regulation protein